MVMAISFEKITEEVLKLPRHQRLMLVRLLVDLDYSGTTEAIDAAWNEEILARVKAVDEGSVAGASFEQIRTEMAERFPVR
jgi:putative addiction module component (TIGR02574 family)